MMARGWALVANEDGRVVVENKAGIVSNIRNPSREVTHLKPISNNGRAGAHSSAVTVIMVLSWLTLEFFFKIIRP